MNGYASTQILGTMVRDPDMRYTAGGTVVVNFGLAVNESWTGQDGQKKERATFIDCEAWGKQAETINEYVKKGQPFHVIGVLQLDQWEKDGQKRSKLKVKVTAFSFVPSPKDDGQPRQPAAPVQADYRQGLEHDDAAVGLAQLADDLDDAIPF